MQAQALPLSHVCIRPLPHALLSLLACRFLCSAVPIRPSTTAGHPWQQQGQGLQGVQWQQQQQQPGTGALGAAPGGSSSGGGGGAAGAGVVSFPTWVRGAARGSCNALFTEQVSTGGT
jgi:hypothetical protein